METIRWLQGAASPGLDAAALLVTNLGMELSYVALLVVAYLAFDPLRGRRLGIYFLIGYFLNEHLKLLVDTPRPYQIDASVLRSEAARLTGTGPGFPSGHAQGATTFWGLAAAYARRAWAWAAALLLIALISATRVYLGLHLPIDVVGGIVIGAAVVVGALLADRILPRPAPAAQWALGLGLPLLAHLLAPTPNSGMILGGLAAFATAPLLHPYRAPPTLLRRAAMAAVGLLLAFAFLFGSSALLPEEAKRQALVAFARYLALGYAGLVLAPLLGRALGLLRGRR